MSMSSGPAQSQSQPPSHSQSRSLLHSHKLVCLDGDPVGRPIFKLSESKGPAVLRQELLKMGWAELRALDLERPEDKDRDKDKGNDKEVAKGKEKARDRSWEQYAVDVTACGWRWRRRRRRRSCGTYSGGPPGSSRRNTPASRVCAAANHFQDQRHHPQGLAAAADAAR